MKKALVSAALVSLISPASSLLAQSAGTVSVQQFAPVAGGNQGFNHVDGTATLEHLKPSFGVFLDYAHRPLALTDLDTGDSVDLVKHDLQGTLLGALGIGKSLQLNLAVPMTIWQKEGSSQTLPVTALASPVMGDIRITPKFRLMGQPDSGVSLALEGTLTLPTGSEESYHSFGSVTFEPRAVFGVAVGTRMHAGLNAGYLLRKEQTLYNLTVGNELTYGVGLSYDLLPDKLTLMGEAFGRTVAKGALTPENIPLEANLAVRFSPVWGHFVTVGAGPGITEGYGTPTWRAFLGYSFAAVAKPVSDTDGDGMRDNVDKCPKEPEDRDRYQDDDGCPDVDNDSDGLVDTQDKCPDEPEDKDGFQDDDGCPDPDQDGDGIFDVSDKCPTEKEDKDKFQDEDGCPDPDNDGDGLLDGVDKCPDAPEDKDGLGDEDGCPEKDFDKDGILDIVDKCPRKPETINGVNDEDGCPDQGASKVKVTSTRIELAEMVYFDTGKATIQPRSFPLLQQVGATLRAYPEITKIEIGGHTDDVGNDEANMKLSQARVDAVKAWLVKYGIEESRLMATGYGESKPIADNATVEGKAKNRRVELKILEVNGKPAGTGSVVIDRKEEAPAKEQTPAPEPPK